MRLPVIAIALGLLRIAVVVGMVLQPMIIIIVVDLLLVGIVLVAVMIIVIALLLPVGGMNITVVVNVIGLLRVGFAVLPSTMGISLLVGTVAMIPTWLHHPAATMSLTLQAMIAHQELELLQEPMVGVMMRGHVIGRLSSPYHVSPIGFDKRGLLD